MRSLRDVVALAALLLLAQAALCQTAPATVYVPAVLGPPGELLRNTAVKVALLPRLPAGYDLAPAWQDAIAGADGGLRVAGKPGVYRLWIRLPGAAIGGTGVVELAAGRETRADMPPLSPTGAIWCLAPPSYRSDERLATLSGGVQPWLAEPQAAGVALDAAGRFTFDDVPPGRYRVYGPGWDSFSPLIDLQAGQRADGVPLDLSPAASQKGQPPVGEDDPTKARLVVDGLVTDATGRPVAGASVGADGRAFYTAGLGGPVRTNARATDTSGAYRVVYSKSPRRINSWLITAEAPGVVDGFAVVRPPDRTADGLQRRRVDVVVGGATGALTIRVARDGKPLSGAYVGAANLLARSVGRSGGAGETTGPDGVARVAGLVPGAYRVHVSWRDGENRFAGSPSLYGAYVRAGADTAYEYALQTPLKQAALSVVAADGSDLTAHRAAIWTGRPADGRLPATDLLTTHGGLIAAGLYGRTGLVAAALAGIDGAIWPDDGQMPGGALYASSPAVERRQPTTFVAGPRFFPQPDAPAPLRSAVVVRLLDPSGRPARGTVRLKGSNAWGEFLGAADGEGRVVFADVPHGRYRVTADVDPAQAGALVGPSGIAIAVGPRPTRRDVRLSPGAFVRGRVQGVSGKLLPLMRLSLTGQDGRVVAAQIDAATGEYQAGPLLPGRVRYEFTRVDRWPTLPGSQPACKLRPGVNRSVNVRCAIDLELPDDELSALPYDPAALEQTVPAAEPCLATVYLPDGKTPAFAALGAIRRAGVPAEAACLTDAAGRLLPEGSAAYSGQAAARTSRSQPRAIAVWLPGSYGAAIAPYYGAPTRMRLVLPRPTAVGGRLTVAGAVPAPISSYRVRAALQGHRELNELLSVEVTPQADGRFELAGLTPGRYRIQAARDDIWLSATRDVTVREGQSLTLNLDIGAIGRPIVMDLVDPAGMPLEGAKVNLHRPPGPLTDELWPRTLTADAEGKLRLEGLEAGRHIIELEGRPGKLAFTVPPLDGPAEDWPLRLTAPTRP